MKNIKDVEKKLNDGIERTDEEREMCVRWLTEFMTANDMSLNEMENLCFEDSDWVFSQIFDTEFDEPNNWGDEFNYNPYMGCDEYDSCYIGGEL